MGFTPCPRPSVRGPAPHSLLRVGFLPSSFHGVGEKTASRAVSFLVLFEPTVCCPFDSGNFGYLSCLCCTHPGKGANPRFTSAQVCARSLSRREWNLSCQLSSMGPADQSLPVFCYYFTDISLFSIHSPLPMLPGVATLDPSNPFSASNFANLACQGSLPVTAGLRASICL